MQYEEKKKLICKITGKITKQLRGNKSQFLFGSENDISTSILNTLEKGNKDPQLTTVFKIAEAFNIKPSELVALIEKELPEGFFLIEK
ncbi:MAG: helix-turn-helix domain-containing protein [Candidatus Gastranaerophilales bacterium]|nr:helix-turn-helix domain-containing protein [Candidatus Gastranaerophilales bacterium]